MQIKITEATLHIAIEIQGLRGKRTEIVASVVAHLQKTVIFFADVRQEYRDRIACRKSSEQHPEFFFDNFPIVDTVSNESCVQSWIQI